MDIERKSYPITGLKSDDDTGMIEAVVSVFSNVDSGNEKVMPGFFKKSIEKKLPKGVWAHDWTQPIAKTLEARELLPGDPLLPDNLKELGGAYVKGQFNLGTQRGREAYSDIKFGIVDEFSIGYKVLKDGKDKESGARELIEGDWKEWSPVLVGMNDQTRLLSIKADEPKDLDQQVKELLATHGDEKIVERINQELNDPDNCYLKGITGTESFESFEDAGTALAKFAKQMRSNHEIRTKEGRVLSTSNRAKVQACKDAMSALIADLDDLLTLSEPKPKEKGIDVAALRIHSDRVRHRLMSRLAP